MANNSEEGQGSQRFGVLIIMMMMMMMMMMTTEEHNQSFSTFDG
jgi:hypothetical protein